MSENQGGKLQREIDAVRPEDYIEPEMADGIFEPVGKFLDDEEKRIYTVMKRINAMVEEKVALLKTGMVKNNEAGRIRAQVRELRDKWSMLKGNLYFHIQDRLDMWDCRLGVSKGWKIIIPEEKEISGMDIRIPLDLTEMLETLEKILKSASEGHKSTVVPGNETIH